MILLSEYELYERMRMYEFLIRPYRKGSWICYCMTIVPKGSLCHACGAFHTKMRYHREKALPRPLCCNCGNPNGINKLFCTRKCQRRFYRRGNRKKAYPQENKKHVDRRTASEYIGMVSR